MLATIGEAPVNSLNTNGLGDVAQALSALNEANREVQDRGWGFNTDERVSIPLSVEGYLYIPTAALRIKPESDQNIRVSQRGNRLYDKDNNTFVFTNPNLLFRIVNLFDFEYIPDVARRYIAVKASRMFQEQYLGSMVIDKFTTTDEYEALAYLQDYDCDTQDFNMIYGNASASNIAIREDSTWLV
jgi:hypothetical protein